MSPGLAKHPQRHCEPLRDSRLDRLPPTSNSCASPVITGMILFRKPDSTFRDHAETSMIAPTARRCKRPRGNRSEIPARRIVLGPVDAKKAVTGSLAEIIIRPNFRPATALLDCDKRNLRWPGPFGSGFLSPQPPGVVRIGPVRRNYPHTGPTRVGPFSFCGCWYRGE